MSKTIFSHQIGSQQDLAPAYEYVGGIGAFSRAEVLLLWFPELVFILRSTPVVLTRLCSALFYIP